MSLFRKVAPVNLQGENRKYFDRAVTNEGRSVAATDKLEQFRQLKNSLIFDIMTRKVVVGQLRQSVVTSNVFDYKLKCLYFCSPRPPQNEKYTPLVLLHSICFYDRSQIIDNNLNLTPGHSQFMKFLLIKRNYDKPGYSGFILKDFWELLNPDLKILNLDLTR